MSAEPVLIETVDRLLTDVCTQDEVERAEADGGWSATTWSALAEAGFPWVGIGEDRGGAGGTLFDAGALVRATGVHAAPVPLAETAMLGGWLLAEAGLSVPAGPVTVAPSIGARTTDAGLELAAPLAWARQAERIVFVSTGSGEGVHPVARHGIVVSVRPEQVSVGPGANLAGEARDRVTVTAPRDDWETAPLPDQASHLLRLRGSLSRSLMAAGALSSIAQLTVDYTNARRQFGQPVARFQAVQHHLVTVAQCAAKAEMAAAVALRAVARGGGTDEVAAARVVVDDAIAVGTRAAHQAHGAMGVTREYRLHQLTRRLWSWRHEWGTTREWRRLLGSTAVAVGADDLFTLVR
jgi:acyl-CoA dehydrogenase